MTGVSGQRWQWARSGDRNDLDGHRGRDIAAGGVQLPADEGIYLRATVTYSDKFGPGKTALAVSARRVEARTLSNAAPRFVDWRGDEVTTVTLSVPENTAVGRSVGRRVSATDADNDLLFYELLDTPDLEDDNGNGAVHHRQRNRPAKSRQGSGSFDDGETGRRG